MHINKPFCSAAVSGFWISAIFWYNILFFVADASTSNPHSKWIWTIFQLQGWENTECHSWMMKMSRQRREIWARLKQPTEWIDCQTDWGSCCETNLEGRAKNGSFQLFASRIWMECWHVSRCAEEASWPRGLSNRNIRKPGGVEFRGRVVISLCARVCVCKRLKRWHLLVDKLGFRTVQIQRFCLSVWNDSTEKETERRKALQGFLSNKTQREESWLFFREEVIIRESAFMKT